MSKTDDLAEVLDEFATYLKLDGQEGRAYAYEKAARTLRQARYVPPDPSDLDGVGNSIRTIIASYQRSGEIAELETLKDEYAWYDELKAVDGIGPARAEKLHEKFNIEDIDDLLLVGTDITLLPRVGETRAENILDSARDVRDRQD